MPVPASVLAVFASFLCVWVLSLRHPQAKCPFLLQDLRFSRVFRASEFWACAIRKQNARSCFMACGSRKLFVCLGFKLAPSASKMPVPASGLAVLASFSRVWVLSLRQVQASHPAQLSPSFNTKCKKM